MYNARKAEGVSKPEPATTNKCSPKRNIGVMCEEAKKQVTDQVYLCLLGFPRAFCYSWFSTIAQYIITIPQPPRSPRITPVVFVPGVPGL